MIREASSPLNNYHGTAQQGRLAAALLPEYVSVDERTLADLLAYAATYAEKVKFYNLEGEYLDPVTGAPMNWSSFLQKDESVFLASFLTANLHASDEDIQAAFLRLHRLQGKQEQVENFTWLITTLLHLTTELVSWYDKSLRLRDTEVLYRITQEIDRAMRGELGYQLRDFGKIAEVLQSTALFPQAEEWQQQITDWLKKWPRQEEEDQLSFPENVKEGVDDLLHYSGSKLQEYYRRLFFTLSYLDELTPDLFAQSLRKKHNHDPDIGLMIAFLRLFADAQAELNKFSARHLAYYNKEVLGREAMPGQVDKAIISLQYGHFQEGITVSNGTLVLAGVNGEGQPSHYQTLAEVFVSRASVSAVKTVFISKNPLVRTDSSYQLVTAIYAAPYANSADGLGAEFIDTDQSWPILGEDQFDLGLADRQMGTSVLGFAIASSNLRLAEGERTVTLGLRFTPESFATLIDLLEDIAENSGDGSNAGDVFNAVFNRPFRLYLTGETGWMPVEKYRIHPPPGGRLGEPALTLQFILPASAPPVFPYDAALHGSGFSTPWPLLKVLLSDEEPIFSYSFLRDLELEQVDLNIDVVGLSNLSVYNDLGLLDASRPFVPFGPLPKRGSFLLVGHPELFNRSLHHLELDLEWGELPEEEGGFTSHYAAYGRDITNDSFKFSLSALSDFSFKPLKSAERDTFHLFTTDLAALPPLRERTSLRLDEAALKRLRLRPLYPQAELPEYSNNSQSGYLKLELTAPAMAFGHSLYPRLFAERMAEHARPRPFSFVPEEPSPLQLPNEPYTPVINRISISYSTRAVINLRRTELKENSPEADDRIFRLHPFGTETVYAGNNVKTPYLLPRFDEDGYLYIGIDQLQPARPLSLFFDITDSQKTSDQRAPDIQWSYLCGDEWKPFSHDQIISDSTVLFSTRGIVQLYCPPDVSKGSGLMDPAYYWFRITASGNLDIAGRCTRIIPHAVEVSWVDNGDQDHLVSPPEARAPISGLATTVNGIAGLQQLCPFYGGQPAETEEAFYVRGSERLRHKNRAANIWDYERLILEKFPSIQQVKCIGRHGYESELPVGRVLIVVVPKIDGTNTMPKVGYHLLKDIERYLSSLCSPFADYRVINPVYEPLKVNCKIKLRDTSKHQGGQVWRELHHLITDFICPWLQEGTLHLGGSVSKTEVLAILNENPHVAFTTAFSMVQVYEPETDYFKMRDTAVQEDNTEVLTPSRPWSVLVPVAEHNIGFLERDEYQIAEVTAIDAMQLETDFIISQAEEQTFAIPPAPPDRNKDKFFELPPDWLLP